MQFEHALDALLTVRINLGHVRAEAEPLGLGLENVKSSRRYKNNKNLFKENIYD